MKYLDPGRRHKQAMPALAAREREAALARATSFRVNRSADGIERDALYSGKRWRKLRLIVIDEEPYCRFCGAPAEHVDHIEHGPNWRERFFDRANLRALCARCHNTRSAQDRAKAKKAKRGRVDIR